MPSLRKNETYKEWYARNREKKIAEVRRYISRNPDKVNEWKKISRNRNIEKRRAYDREWKKANRDKVAIQKRYSRIRKMGISVVEYEDLLQKQNYKCLICFSDPNGTYKVLHLDHDHETKKFRGLLCGCCNVMIGMAHDDVAILQRAIDYLQGRLAQ